MENGHNEEVKEEEAPVKEKVYDNACINVDQLFREVESERLEKVKSQNPDIEKFSVLGFEDTINCSLKHIFLVFLNYNIKWPHLENLSLAEWINKYPLTNIDVSLNSPEGLSGIPDYFTKSEEPTPSPEDFKNWPLTTKYRERVTHLVEKPKFMQPKQNKCE